MPLPLRPAHLFVLFTYLVLSAVPFVPLLLGMPMARPWQLLGMEVAAWMALWAVFQRPAYFHWLLLPAFLALPFEVYLQAFFDQELTAHHLGILAESSPGEALEFIGNKAWAVLATLVAVTAWWVGDTLAWRGRSRWLVLGLVGVLAALAAYGYEFGVAGSRPDKSTGWGAPVKGAHHLGWHGLPPLPEAVMMAEGAMRPQMRPFGLLAHAAEYYKERSFVAGLSASAAAFRFQARQAQAAPAPETIVLVLGESSRFDRWRLNGYARDTTPLLAQEPNLVVLSDVVTPVAATRRSVPLLSTRKPALDGLTEGFNEKSFLSAYKEAGFRTWWLSNQLTYGTHDSPITAIAQEADEVKHLNPGGYSGQSSFDEVLLAPLRRALASPAPKQLMVLHTLGSHWNYGRRYPPRFEHWQPSLSGIAQPDLTDASLHALASNSYDNSVLYTDWFLAQVIGELKQSGRSAALVYVSDHGEVLRSESCRQFLHGQGTRSEFHVPALVWHSDRYQAIYPEKVAQLRRNRHARIGTPDFFHTMLDLADIRYPGEQRAWSFAHAGFTPRTRMVSVRGSWLDYDAASTSGACQGLVKPTREKPPVTPKKTG
jgi:glucan phosphoethanolaminetransferase (alkaline phosphatase superfamily)